MRERLYQRQIPSFPPPIFHIAMSYGFISGPEFYFQLLKRKLSLASSSQKARFQVLSRDELNAFLLFWLFVLYIYLWQVDVVEEQWEMLK